MRAAMAVNRVTTDFEANLAGVERLAEAAAATEAKLLLFPEAALTGLSNNDIPAHDLPLGVPVPGAVTEWLAGLSRRLSLWLGIGVFEREEDCLYDSALLFTPEGELALKYRRMSRGWHSPQANRDIYREGEKLPFVAAPFGKVCFLICGDLFDDATVERVRQEGPDLALFPFARSCDGPWSQARWDAEEMATYAGRVQQTGVPFLMTNYLALDPSAPVDERYFGGAWALAADGSVIASLPLGTEGLLTVDL